ncbi:MAG: MaoC family dehydratase [Alphaproteobacteria bacterium]
MPLKLKEPVELRQWVGKALGRSEPLLIDQSVISRFAVATGDDQWIHVDTARALRDMPSGKTIAHGYLVLALLPVLMREILDVGGCRQRINYGSNRVRFITPVTEGSRVRLAVSLLDVNARSSDSILATFENRMNIEGAEKPAMIAETMTLFQI